MEPASKNVYLLQNSLKGSTSSFFFLQKEEETQRASSASISLNHGCRVIELCGL